MTDATPEQGQREHEPTCAYYGLPFTPGSSNRVCSCPGTTPEQDHGPSEAERERREARKFGTETPNKPTDEFVRNAFAEGARSLWPDSRDPGWFVTFDRWLLAARADQAAAADDGLRARVERQVIDMIALRFPKWKQYERDELADRIMGIYATPAPADLGEPDAWRDERDGRLYMNRRKHPDSSHAYDGDGTPLWLTARADAVARSEGGAS